MAGLMALRSSGRSTVTTATGPCRSRRRYGVPSQSPSGGRGGASFISPNLSSIHRMSGSGGRSADYRRGMPARRTPKTASSAPSDAGGNGSSAPSAGEGDDVDRKASRRQERRLLHQDLSRTQLLDAAEEVFGRKGFHDTTLKEIADLAEFSVGSVYSFFENKDDLFLNVFLRRGAEFLPGM